TWTITMSPLRNLQTSLRSFVRWLKSTWRSWRKIWRPPGRLGLLVAFRSGMKNKTLATDLRGFTRITPRNSFFKFLGFVLSVGISEIRGQCFFLPQVDLEFCVEAVLNSPPTAAF